MVTKIGLDLGYANITLSDASLEVVREPSVALLDGNTRRILSVGSVAMSTCTQDGSLVRPLRNGILYSAEFTEQIIAKSLESLPKGADIRCAFGIGASFNSRQLTQLASILHSAGVKECFFVNRALASIVGAGFVPTMSVVSVNIGAKSTEIAILHEGKIVYSATENIGGEDFDEAVREYILKNGELNISLQDARAIKESIGAVWEGREAEPIEVTGTLALTGNRIHMSICTEDILGVFEKPLYDLLNAVAVPLRRLDAKYIDAVLENGIVLTGGGSQLFGLDKMMRNVFKLPATQMKDADDCVARGLAAIAGFLPVKTRSEGKDITAKIPELYNEYITSKKKKNGD